MSNYLRGVVPDVLCDIVDVQLQVNDAMAKLTASILQDDSSSDDELAIRRPMFDRTYIGHRYVLDVLVGHPGVMYFLSSTKTEKKKIPNSNQTFLLWSGARIEQYEAFKPSSRFHLGRAGLSILLLPLALTGNPMKNKSSSLASFSEKRKTTLSLLPTLGLASGSRRAARFARSASPNRGRLLSCGYFSECKH
ncbi:hypothetical protein M5K25_014815 [Dendrobium thyrsiflorum]|uniref:Uncharacterized protein n=1 Tax=Dendrobium thyrsiflorum TaxID=117978 RepID=A0ABD0UVI5_DENTH